MGNRAAHFRSLVRGRALVVIDNVRASTEVQPLLPGDEDSVVIVTSWAPLPHLPRATLVPLGPLSDAESVELLRVLSGRHESVAGTAERTVAGAVGHLPLALQICAGLAKVHADWDWEAIATRIVGSNSRMNTDLSAGTSVLRANLDVAYADLDADTATAYRQLGRMPNPWGPASLVRALVGGARLAHGRPSGTPTSGAHRRGRFRQDDPGPQAVSRRRQ